MNEENDKIRGWRDLPLSPKGKEEVVRLGKKLKGEDFDGIISSDLERARQTAEAIAKETGKPIYGYTRSLRPWDAGELTGQEANKIVSKMNHYIDHPEETVRDGESFNTFKDRYLTAIQDIKKYFPKKTILIVAHHRNNVLLDGWIKDGEKKDFQVNRSKMEGKGISPAEFKIYQLTK